jgi:tetratricopeptide (TPR) repeat protein
LKKILPQQITKLLQESQKFFSSNNFQEAENNLNYILNSYPQHPGAKSKLAVIYLSTNKLHEGIELLKQSLAIDPFQHEAINNLSIALLNSQQYSESLKTIKQLVALNPNFPDIFFNLGLIYKSLNLIDKAIESYLEAIKRNLSHLPSYLNASSCYIELYEYNKAIGILNDALKLIINSPELFYNLGLAHFYAEEYNSAINYLSKAIQLLPESYQAYNNRGLAFHKLQQFENALNDFNSAIKIHPQYAEAYNNIGVLLQDQKNSIHPEYFKKALEIDPFYTEAAFNLSIVHLLNLNFKDGFNLYEKRNKVISFINKYKYLNKPYLDFIADNSQKLVIRAEQGIGDQILFLSLLQEALSINKNITVYLDKRLIPIFRRSFNSNIFFSEDESFELNNYDAHMLCGSLCKQLRSNINDFKFQPSKYLKPDVELSSKIRSKFHKKIICGISWRSNNKDFGAAKSLSLKDLTPILELDKIEFVDLQYGDTSEERSDLLSKQNIKITKISEIDNFNDIDGLASLIYACDFVITSSNFTAHLSGAIGKKTFLITPKSFGKIWYWQSSSNHSLWYPSVIIYPQKEDDNWEDPIKLIKSTIIKENYGSNN